MRDDKAFTTEIGYNEGWQQALVMVRASLRDYPTSGDAVIMHEIDRIVAERMVEALEPIKQLEEMIKQGYRLDGIKRLNGPVLAARRMTTDVTDSFLASIVRYTKNPRTMRRYSAYGTTILDALTKVISAAKDAEEGASSAES